MAKEPQLFYIGTSKIKEIRMQASVSYEWGNYSAWKKFKSPVKASQKKVKYNKTSKNKKGASKYGGLGGITKWGTHIPATVDRMVGGVELPNCPVRYYQRGYTIFDKTAKLKKDNKMSKTVYTKDKPYQYRLQYKDKPVYTASYSKYENGIDYIYFAPYYYSGDTQVSTTGHLPHPTEVTGGYSDVMRNLESNANNNENRDNKGTFVLKNVRANVVTLKLTWEGLNPDEGADLLDTLNPSKDKTGQYNYLTVQYFDPAKQKAVNKTFYSSDRAWETMPNGCYRKITVTLTEV